MTLSICRKLSPLSACKKSTSSSIFSRRYCKDCKLLILGTLRMPGYTQPSSFTSFFRHHILKDLAISLADSILAHNWRTEEPKLCQIWDWWWNINKNIGFRFRLFPVKNDKIFQNIKKKLGAILGPFCPNLGQKRNFYSKRLCQFLLFQLSTTIKKKSEKKLTYFSEKMPNWRTKWWTTVILKDPTQDVGPKKHFDRRIIYPTTNLQIYMRSIIFLETETDKKCKEWFFRSCYKVESFVICSLVSLVLFVKYCKIWRLRVIINVILKLFLPRKKNTYS